MYRNLIEGKKVVCFDLDGTIVDTEAYFVQAFGTILATVNKEVSVGTVYGIVGVPINERWETLSKQEIIPRSADVNDLTTKTMQEYLKLISTAQLEVKAGFWDIAYAVKDKDLKLALTTNSTKDVAMQVLQKLEIDEMFDFVIFGDDVRHKKPHPEIYSKTARHFGVKPQEMLVFEDSIPGTQSVINAGADLIVVWDGQTVQRLFPKEAKIFITDFEGLAQNLDYTVDEEVELLKKQIEAQEAPTQKTSIG